MASGYRKRKGSDTWHFCSNCSEWPTVNYDYSATKPTSGELCNQCKDKDKKGNCS